MPMVNVVEGAFCLSRPQRRNHGAPSSLPVRSCRAMSTAALPAASPSERESMRARISSVRKGSSNSSSTVCAFCRKAATLCGDPSSRRHRGLAVSRHAVVVDLDLYVGCRRARVCGYGEDMPQLELVWKEPQTHAGAAAAVDVEYVARSVVAGHGVEAETGACRKAGHRLEKLFSCWHRSGILCVALVWVVRSCSRNCAALSAAAACGLCMGVCARQRAAARGCSCRRARPAHRGCSYARRPASV